MTGVRAGGEGRQNDNKIVLAASHNSREVWLMERKLPLRFPLRTIG